MFKRSLSLLLVVCMVLSFVPFHVFAAEVTDPTEVSAATEVQTEQTTEPAVTEPEATTEVTEPSTETATEAVTEATELSTEATEPSTEATEPSTEVTEPSTEATEPSAEVTEPSEELPEETQEATEPSEETIEGGEDAIELLAGETEAAVKVDEVYKIVHLDAGRKYFSKDVIIKYIDLMAAYGYNQLQLYLSDNQGFRLMLDDMEFTASDGETYDLESAVGDGYTQDYDSTYTSWYRPSLETGKNYLTQDEMTAIISHAKEKGIEIVPAINMPGHMGAILEEFASFRYSGSQSSLDLGNETAVAFALGLLKHYAEYFAGQGCRFFSICADEYAYDVTTISAVCSSEATYTNVVNFMNQAADVITSITVTGANTTMTPRAFSDFFGWDSTSWTNHPKITTDYQIYYWAEAANGQSLKTLAQLEALGYTNFINTNEGWYFALGSAYYTYAKTVEGVGAANMNSFIGGKTTNNGVGAMFCIWNDRGRLDDATAAYHSAKEPAGGDAGLTVYNLTEDLIKTFAYQLGGTFTDTTQSAAVKVPFTVAAGDSLTVTHKIADELVGKVSIVKESETYDVTITKADGTVYTGVGTVTLPVPAEWDTELVYPYVRNDDGTYTKIKERTFANNQCTFETPHFSEMIMTLEAESEEVVIDIASYYDANGNQVTDRTADPIVLENLSAELKDASGNTSGTVRNINYNIENESHTGEDITEISEVDITTLTAGQKVEVLIQATSNSQTHYMSVNGTSIADETNAANAVDWTITRTSDATALYFTISCEIDNTTYYLLDDGSKISLTTDSSTASTYKWNSSVSAFEAHDQWSSEYLAYHSSSGWMSNTLDWSAPATPVAEKTTPGATTYTATITFTASDDAGAGDSAEIPLGGVTYLVEVQEHTHTGGTATCANRAVCTVCGNAYGDTDPNTHVWNTVYEHDGSEHWQKCTNCAATTEKESHGGGTATCENSAVCTVCGNSYGNTDPNNHVWSEAYTSDEENHWYTCSNPACTATTEKEAHTGGMASCASGKICKECGKEYTQKNPLKHTGGTETEAMTPATSTADGNTGRTLCKGCGAVLHAGTVLPATNGENIEEVVLKVGETSQTYKAEGDSGALSAVVEEIDWDTTIATYTLGNHTSGSLKVDGGEVGSIAADGTTEFLIRYVDNDGKEYFMVRNSDNTLGSTNIKASATKWVLTSDGYVKVAGTGATSGYSGVSLYYEGSLKCYTDWTNTKWSYDSTHGLYIQGTSYNGLVYNNGWAIETNATTGIAKIFTADIDAVPSVTEVTFEGIAAGQKKVKINNTIYRVTVLEEVDVAQSLAVDFFITNTAVTGDQGSHTYYIYATDTGFNADTGVLDKVADVNGVAIDEIGQEGTKADDGTITVTKEADFPYFGYRTKYPDVRVAYGYGMYLPGKIQGNWDYAETATTDYSDPSNGTEFYYIRYYDKKWWVAGEKRDNWVEIDTSDWTKNDLVAYYFQETEVTSEKIVTTYVQDWGELGNVYKGHGDNTDWVLMDFAIKFDGGDRIPDLDGFPISDKTVFFHNIEDKSPELVEQETYTDADGKEYTINKRHVRTVEGLEKFPYEVYMVTVKPTSDIPMEELNGATPADAIQYDYVYNGTEEVVWLDGQMVDYLDEETNELPESVYGLPISDDYGVEFGENTWGNPSFDGVWIYEHQGVLVTYYIRLQDAEENLHVFYRVDDGKEYEIKDENGNVTSEAIKGTKIFDYQISPYVEEIKNDAGVVTSKEYEYFDPNFAADAGSTTGLTHNTVKNAIEEDVTVTSVLSSMTQVPTQYRDGSYQFAGKILYGYEAVVGGTQTMVYITRTELDELIQAGNAPDITHVVLYYEQNTVGQIHYVPVDFGSPLVMDESFFHLDTTVYDFESLALYVDQEAGSDPLTQDQIDKKVNDMLSFGEVTVSNNAATYTPDKVMTGAEHIFTFELTVDITTTNADGATSTAEDQKIYHSVVFVPATTVYYEEGFATYTSSWGGNTGSKPTADSEAQETKCYLQPMQNYGYDKLNEAENTYGINGTDTPGHAAHTSTSGAYAAFEFTGTGVEIYANSTDKTGMATISILQKKDDGSYKTVKLYVVDTRILSGKTNATTYDFAKAYNVPIVSALGLPYGNYEVRVGYVTNANFKDRTDHLYFDGFRIYGTMKEGDELASTDVTAGRVYAGTATVGMSPTTNERAPVFEELRDIVLNSVKIPASYKDEEGLYSSDIANELISQVHKSGTNTITGIVIDNENNRTTVDDEIANAPTAETETTETDKVDTKDEITVDLIDNGPKNEIYLMPDQAVAFKFNASYTVQLGMKALDGPVDYTVDYTATQNGDGTPKVDVVSTLQTSTDMYYPLGSQELSVIIVKNVDETNILSITKLKCLPESYGASTASVVDTIGVEEVTEIFNALGYARKPVEEDSEVTDPSTPADDPTEESKPADDPTEESKPADDPTEESKPADDPTEESKPADDPTEESKPADDPTEESKPADDPTEESKPADDSTEDTKPVNPFVDVFGSDYYYDPVLWAYGEEITKGKDATHFAPVDDCTRAEIVTFLWRAMGEPEPEATFTQFKDVKSGDYFYKAVLWASQEGITTGTSASRFSPNETASRAQVATFLWRAMGKPVTKADAQKFEDVQSGTYYADAVAWAAGNEITNGVDAKHFAPNDTCKRGQIATFLYRTFAK